MATAITPEVIEKSISDFKYRYLKHVLTSLLVGQCQKDISAITEKLAKYKETYASPTYNEKEYLEIIDAFEKVSKLAELIPTITEDEVLDYIETFLLHSKQNIPLVGVLFDFNIGSGEPLIQNILDKIFKEKKMDEHVMQSIYL